MTSKGFTTKLLESKIGPYRQFRVSIPKNEIEDLNLGKGDKVRVKINKTYD